MNIPMRKLLIDFMLYLSRVALPDEIRNQPQSRSRNQFLFQHYNAEF
jgi:hypothetical protein